MRLFVASLVLVAAACAQPAVAADTNKEKIVGKWKMVKGEGVPAGTVIEFGKDGKVSVTVDIGGKSMTIDIGTYTVEGDKVTVKTKLGDKEDTEVNDIKSLTADKLVLVDPKKKEAELARVK